MAKKRPAPELRDPDTFQRFVAKNGNIIMHGLKPRTVTEYHRLIKKVLTPEFGNKLLTTITTESVERWHKAAGEATPYQANRALAVLSKVMGLAVRFNRVSQNPCSGVKYFDEQPRERVLTDEETRRLFQAIGNDLTPEQGSFILVALYTGARPGELASARWEWLIGEEIQLPDSKTGRRTIYLPHAALAALAPVRDVENPQPRGLIYPGIKSPTDLWKKVRRKAELPKGVRLYDLRHTFASAALEAGEPLEAISHLLGHKDPKTTWRYTHMMPESGRRAAGNAASAIDKRRGG